MKYGHTSQVSTFPEKNQQIDKKSNLLCFMTQISGKGSQLLKHWNEYRSQRINVCSWEVALDWIFDMAF